MNRSRLQTAHRPRNQIAPWLNFAGTIEPAVKLTLNWFEMLGYRILLQSDIVSGRHQDVFRSYNNGILGDRFRQAMQRINPGATQQQIESTLKQLTAARTLPLLQQNRQWHLQLSDGISVKASTSDPSSLTTLNLLDFSNLQNNDWLVIYSFPVIELGHQHCLDLVVFINGLPLAIFQGLHAGQKEWSLRAAYLQLQDYQTHLPKFFSLNELIVLSNGVQSRIGTLTNQWKQFTPIQSANGNDARFVKQTETLIHVVFQHQHLLEMLQNHIVFQQSRTKLTKKLRPPSRAASPSFNLGAKL